MLDKFDALIGGVIDRSLGIRIPSAGTVLRAIEELMTYNVNYTTPQLGKNYDFNTAEKLLPGRRVAARHWPVGSGRRVSR